MIRHRTFHYRKQWIVVLLLPVLLMGGCSSATATPTPTLPSVTTIQEKPPLSQIGFTVQLPSALASDQTLYIELLDEVTGLALNSQKFEMQSIDATHYNAILSIPVGSVIKYRYIRQGKITAIEYTSQGKQVRYRLFIVTNPALIQDVISAWIDQPFHGASGRIQGRVINAKTKSPFPASLVAAGGQQTLTSSDGSFLLDGIPPGTHNLVIYSPDGLFTPFQQGATVAKDSATPADILVNPSQYVNITFIVRPPEGSPKGIPIRLIGNTYSLGNTFADLRGGINDIASRAPLLTPQEDGNYTLTLSLPVGLDLRYKYTLGDGFWNAERSENGGYHLRQMIVADHDTTQVDDIDSWMSPGKGSITFTVNVPASTSPNDTISIQFNPYGWTEPIPMWPMGDNKWIYILYNPLDLIGDSTYRYCRNDQCGTADDAATEGPDAAGKPFSPSAEAQVFEDTVNEWAWIDPDPKPITVTNNPINVKPAGFFTGVELFGDYHPSWQPYYGWAFKNINTIQSQTVMIVPTWHYTNNNPPVLGPVSGIDAPWYDLGKMINNARQNNLQVAIHPEVAYYKPADVWWAEGKRDDGWWQSWFDRYETFIVNFADLAEQTGAETLILGDSSLAPALPGGKLFDGQGSNVPGSADTRWNDLIKKVRERYKGKLGWYLTYPADFNNLPSFLNNFDEIFVVINGKLTDSDSPGEDELRNSFTNILVNQILPVHNKFNKPLILGISYPSAKTAATGCVKSSGACLPPIVFTQGGLDITSVDVDLQGQADIYNAFLEAATTNENVAGVFASGYYPPVALADKSTSIHGKPSSDVVWFWFEHLNGPPK